MAIKFILRRNSPDATAPLSEHIFEGNLMTIGSDAANTIVLPKTLSEQAIIIREGEQITLINSGEGTSINDRALRREAMEPLNIGDEIKIGEFIIFVADGSQSFVAPIRSTVVEETASIIAFSEKNALLGEIAAKEETTYGDKAQNAEIEAEAKKPTRNFAEVLNALRTEEDSFYFIVENGSETEKSRVPIEQSEMPVGLSANGQITCAVNQINALYAIVRKDWSGIVVESQRGGAVSVNDETIKTTARLRNGDRLTFNGAKKTNKKLPYLELHEPSSLVALESILETRSRNGNLYGNNSVAGNGAPLAQNANAAPPISIFERNFFGYFSFFEFVAMSIGTLIAAVLIFLLLEYSI